MRKLILTIILGFSLVGCGGNADGTYVAMTKGGFLKPSLPVVLTIKGDKAEMNVADMEKLSMSAEFSGDILSLHNGNPKDSLKFHVTNDGQTLQCNICEQVGMPKMWEKQS
ncbi:hypothetical protein ACE1OE_10680 [Vibrio sp. E150_011]